MRTGGITKGELLESADRYGKSPYGRHLKDVAEGRVVIIPSRGEYYCGPTGIWQ